MLQVFLFLPRGKEVKVIYMWFMNIYIHLVVTQVNRVRLLVEKQNRCLDNL